MSLLGRLEDLSLTDIVQIVYLSRRTGVLEIINDRGRHTVMFRAAGWSSTPSSPEHPDLVAFLARPGCVAEAANARLLRQMEESGIPSGTAVAGDESPLRRRSGERDPRAHPQRRHAAAAEQGRGVQLHPQRDDESRRRRVRPRRVFKDGGFAPQPAPRRADGEKIKPLRGLEESLKVGKALLRGSAPAEATPASLNLGLGQPIEPPSRDSCRGTDAVADATTSSRFRRPQRARRARRRIPADRRAVPPDAERRAAVADVRRTHAAARHPDSSKSPADLFEVESPEAHVSQRRAVRAQPARARRRAARVHEARREDLRSTARSTTCAPR